MATRVLIVDDNENNLYLLESILKASDYQVISAQNGQAALEMAQAQPPDLIVSDILMPVMDGFAFCRECKSNEQLKHIPFVFYTATYTEPKDERFALDLGADRFMIKPQEPEILIKVLIDLLNEKKTFKPAMEKPLSEEMEFLRQHNEALFKKLEKKILDLEATNQELKDLEERYRLSFDQVSDVIFMIDADLRISSISPSLKKILGYKPEEFIGRPVSDFKHILTPDSFEKAVANIRLVLKGEMLQPNLYEFIARDGTRKHIEIHGSPIIRNGQIAGTVSVARDISERKQTDEKLKASESRYKMLFTHAAEGILVAEVQTRQFIHANPALCRMFGCTEEEILRLGVKDIHPEESLEHVLAEFDALSRGEKTHAPNIPCLHKNGSLFYADISTTSMILDGVQCNVGFFTDITKRKEAENELQKLASIVRHSSDLINLATPDGKMVFLNEAGCQMLGIEPEKVNEYSIEDVIPDHLLPMIRTELLPAIQKGSLWEGELQYRNLKTGMLTDVYAMTFTIADPDSTKTRYLANVSHDITERKRSAEVLRESEAFRQRIFESSQIPIVVMDTDTFQYVDCNAAATKVYRFSSREETLGKTPLDVSAPVQYDNTPSSEKARFYIDKALAEGVVVFEWRHQRPDGEIWDAEVHLMSFQSQKRNFIQFTLHDITDRKQAENALRLSEARLIESQCIAKIGNWEHDLLTNKFIWSDEMFRLFEIDRERVNLSYELLLETIHPEDREAFNTIFTQQAFTHLNTYGIIHRLRMPDGRIKYVNAQCRTQYNPEGKPIRLVGTAQDITELKQAELEKEQLQERLNQSQKMESIGRLAGGVAHDFNNMLGVILGHAELAMEKIEPDQPLYADLREIRKAAERSTSLTRQLLAFARKQTVSPRVIDMNETVAGMLKMLQRLIGEDIHLAWLPGVNPWPVRIDPSQIDQILANLCVNARDAIAGVGKVTIELANLRFDDAFCVDHPDFISGDYVLLSVSDNGCGMDKEIRDKLFEPFFTTKEIGKGTGLGLATVYGIVRQNNGFINVYSEIGQGTTFRIYLPRHIGKAEQGKSEEPQESVIRGHETLLVVEDELAILNLSKIMLEKQGYRVLSAATPGEAIQLAEEHHGEIHLLITDVVMPEMNGRDLAKKILSLYPDMKRLFMSGYTADVIAHQGVLDEGVSFIQKPFSRNGLIAKVRQVLDQK